MQETEKRVWTLTAYLLSGAVTDGEVAEAEKIKVGMARLNQGRLQVELLPGLAVSGQLMFDFTEADV